MRELEVRGSLCLVAMEQFGGEGKLTQRRFLRAKPLHLSLAQTRSFIGSITALLRKWVNFTDLP